MIVPYKHRTDPQSAYRQQLHKENSLFMSGALFGVPAIGIIVLMKLLLAIGTQNSFQKILALALTFMFISTSMMLGSFFTAEWCLEEESTKWDKATVWLHKLSFIFTMMAFSLIAVGFYSFL